MEEEKKILFPAKPSYSICSANGVRDVRIRVPPPPFFITEDKAVVKNSPQVTTLSCLLFLKMASQYDVLHAWFHFRVHGEKRIVFTSVFNSFSQVGMHFDPIT